MTFYLLEPDEWVECPEVLLKGPPHTLILRVARFLQVSPPQETLSH
jgi:hypothetical protein